MLILILYLSAVLLLLLFLISMSVYTLSLIYSSMKGSPYVATRKQTTKEILKGVPLKKGKLFVELGSGDGRIVRTAARLYKIKGIGVDVNPLLVFWSGFLSRLDGTRKDVAFYKKNIFETDLTKADYVYIFLMPKLIEELTVKMDKEVKKGATVISHGFPIKVWKNKLFKKVDRSPFPTYYYKVK